MKILIVLVVAVFSVLIMMPSESLGHSGGTDAYGCHWNHKTGGYHCH